jgi:hypothetical protein
MPQLAVVAETAAIVEVSPRELVVVGNGVVERYSLMDCRYELRDARCSNRFVRHLAIDGADGVIDLITPPEIGAIAPRAARLPEMLEPTAVIAGELMVVLVDWLDNRRRLIGHTVVELALLSRLASASYAIAIGERAADLIAGMTWEVGSPLRSSAAGGRHQLLAPFEIQATVSDRANLALMAALARAGRID